jgi:hypothetical protein
MASKEPDLVELFKMARRGEICPACWDTGRVMLDPLGWEPRVGLCPLCRGASRKPRKEPPR